MNKFKIGSLVRWGISDFIGIVTKEYNITLDQIEIRWFHPRKEITRHNSLEVELIRLIEK